VAVFEDSSVGLGEAKRWAWRSEMLSSDGSEEAEKNEGMLYWGGVWNEIACENGRSRCMRTEVVRSAQVAKKDIVPIVLIRKCMMWYCAC
jgi:hypothetical protein